MHNLKTDILRGLGFGILATLLWGSYPLWYKPLRSINAWELLSWRIVFSESFLVFFLIVTLRYKKISSVLNLVVLRKIGFLSLILGFWWYVYIYGMLNNRILEVSIGYFVSPIISILISRLFFKEKITLYQSIAVLLAIMGVGLMLLRNLGVHNIPWIALSIGCCFSFYGIFKKQVPGDPLVTQTLEILFITPFAIAFLFWLFIHGQVYTFKHSTITNLLLVSTGIITILPLWWYSIAAQALPLKTLSFLQFIPPTCNFLLGILIYQEPFDTHSLTTFILIWIGVIIYTIDSMLKNNRSRNQIHMEKKRI